MTLWEHNFTERPSDVSDMAHMAHSTDLLSTKVNAHVCMSCSTVDISVLALGRSHNTLIALKREKNCALQISKPPMVITTHA